MSHWLALRTLFGQAAWAPLLLGAALRVAWVALCPNQPTSDQFIYHEAAVFLARGLGYVEASGVPAGYWPVGYPAALAPFYAALGEAPSSAFVANTLLGLLTLWGGAKLASAWFGDGAGRLGAWIVAVHPSLVLYTTCIASENAFMPALLWFAYFATRAASSAGASEGAAAWLWAALAGVLAGLAGYVRGTIVLMGILPLVLLLRSAPLSRALALTAWMGACAGVTLLPWALRNHAHFGEYQPFSFNGATNLWMGNHEGTHGGYTELPPEVEGLPLAERERVLGQRAREFIFQNPLEYAVLCVKRTLTTLQSDTIAVVWNHTGIEATFGARVEPALKVALSAVHWLLYGSLLARLVRAAYQGAFTRRWPLSLGESAVLASFVALSIPFVFIVSGNRYHLPLLPFACLWVGHVVVQVRAARAASAVAT